MFFFLDAATIDNNASTSDANVDDKDDSAELNEMDAETGSGDITSEGEKTGGSDDVQVNSRTKYKTQPEF